MLKKSTLTLALMLTIASAIAAIAAPEPPIPRENYNQTFDDPPAEELLANRVTGNLD